MNFKPIEITLPPPSSFDDSMGQFIGQKLNDDMLYAIKARTKSQFSAMMAMGQIKSIPKVYVGVEANQLQHVVIQTQKYIHDCEEYMLMVRALTQETCLWVPLLHLCVLLTAVTSLEM
jgi:hypothetical protein